MSSLENLTAKIIGDAELRAGEITAQGKAQAEAAIAARIEQANNEAQKIIADAQKLALETAEQIALQNSLKIRDEKLEAKQQLVDRVFALALEKLSGMPKDDFWKLVSESLVQIETDGEKLTVPAKYNTTSLDELNAFLKKNGKKGNLVPETEPRPIASGFILAKDGIEHNNTFEVLLNHYRHQLESTVLKELF